MGSRILPHAADALRDAIRQAGGNEVFAIGDIDGRSVESVQITCRGTKGAVVALIDRPRPGQVVIHNHPSGDLTPSEADMALASRYGEKGVGVVIVDNAVTSANWVVEPFVEELVALDPTRVLEVFESSLPAAMPGFEARRPQIDMALAVTDTLNRGRPLVVEAGTGTGKSLAYLIPSALWAITNDRKVVVSTFTKTLQTQLSQSDVPLLHRAGIAARVQVLQGRNNYACKRRLALAVEGESEPGVFDALQGWSDTTADGSRADIPFGVDSVDWDRVYSDSDLTMSSRCSHFGSCHWYTNLRRAAAAHVVVVNHALLLADLTLRSEIGRGILPQFNRLVLDEAHHLEQAATGAASKRLSAESVRQAVRPLLDRGRRRGALGQIARSHLTSPTLEVHRREAIESAIFDVEGRVSSAVRTAEDTFASIAALLPVDRTPVRLDEAKLASEDWSQWLAPTLRNLALELEKTADRLEDLQAEFDDFTITERQIEPHRALTRAKNRLQSHVDIARSFLAPGAGVARWYEVASRRDADSAAIVAAPVDVAPTLRDILWRPMKGTVATSATLAINDSFTHWRTRVGAPDLAEAKHASPFNHFEQAILGLPRDLSEPNSPAFLPETADFIERAVRISDGGAFVLCTSYAAVSHYAAVLRREPGRRVLAQGEGVRSQLLRKFMDNPHAVLVGTDSFWEGVSVKGFGLRLVVIPRIPFRVPTDPLNQARQEHLKSKGLDPFAVYTLPEAILKLRQGYGRLIRAKSDRGAVLLLDSRVHSRRYGRRMLSALPPARRVKGPSSWVESELRSFFEELMSER